METLNIHLPFRYPVPVNWHLSFKPYLEYLEAQISQTNNSLYNSYLRSIAGILYDNPVLLEPIKDWSVLKPYHELIDLIRLNHLSSSDEKSRYAIGIPFPMRFFSYSQSFKEFITDADGQLKLNMQDNFIEEEHYRRVYHDILNQCYGITDLLYKSSPNLLRLTNNLISYKTLFHFNTNDQFVKLRYNAVLPPLENDWIEYVKGNIVSYKNLVKPALLEQFFYEGFLLFTVKDDTLEESLNELRHTIATMHTLSVKEAFTHVKSNILSMLGKEGFEIGFLPLVEVNKKVLYHRFFNYTSILTRIMKKYIPSISSDHFFEKFIFSFVSSDEFKIQIYSAQKEKGSEIEGIMALEGIKSFAVIPIFNRKNLVGLIELASHKDDITIDSIRMLEYAAPMFREFIVYQTDRLHEQMESFIKSNFSAIQPEIQWKFNEIAWQAIQYSKSVVPQIIFRNLIPFYGAVDIRNSSLEHRKAVFEDATIQLMRLQSILENEKENNSDLISQIEGWLQLIYKNQVDDREVELIKFIENTTESIRLKFPDITISWEHKEEGKYEKSISIINRVLKRVLDAQERKLKNSNPVYFDKYRTDGWEYSIYVGQELNPWFQYSPDLIAKIKKWEFETVFNMGFAAAVVRKRLPVQLETTQLILAQTNPVDIRFRLDEHRFDVEGAYSIRYEVTKKRIDKICISNTQERLTQPGKISIAYLYPEETEHYLEMINEYIKQDKLSKEIEYLDLEETQGITGLKAIRVSMKQ